MHAAISDFIADVVQNAWEADATRIELTVRTGCGEIDVTIADNGRGMTPAVLAHALDPFISEAGKHDARRVGLGLPFLQQAVEAVDGSLAIDSVPGSGTTVRFRFPAAHADTPPLGRVARAAASLMALTGDFDLVVNRQHNERAYTTSRHELIDALGGLDDAAGLLMARRYLDSLEDDVTEG